MTDMFRLMDRSEDLTKKKELRPHQSRAIHLLRSSLGKGNRKVVVQGPTGFGKTLVAAKIIEGAIEKGNTAVFMAPAISLIDQTVEAFEAEGIASIGVMQANHPRTDPSARVQVCSVQTLRTRDIPKAPLFIVDECHISHEVIYRVMDQFPDAFFVGLTATPWAKGMGLRWQDLVIPTSIGELIDGGYLSRFTVYAPDVPDLSKVKTVSGDYQQSQLAEVMSEGGLVGHVADTWLKDGENRPTLCFAVNRSHAADLRAQFAARGVASEYVDGNTDRVERNRIGRLFSRGEVKVICSVRTMTTGVDLPVSCIIDAAPTKSEILHVQKIGRGLRINPGTEDLKILDHAGNSLRLGLVTEIGADRLDDTEKGARQERKPKADKLPKPCTGCGVLHTSRACPACGKERRPVSGVETHDGQLVEITGNGKAPTRAEKQAFWSGLLTVMHKRGRQQGWASHAYRERFGVWPRGLDDIPGVASQEVWNFVKWKDIRYAKSRERHVS